MLAANSATAYDIFRINDNNGNNIFRINRSNYQVFFGNSTVVIEGINNAIGLASGGEYRGLSYAPIILTNATIRWPNNSPDIQFNRLAAGVLGLYGSSTSVGSTLAIPPNTPSQITSDQNDYNPGNTSFFQRWSTDASRNITGLTFTATKQPGQPHEIWNVGSQNIVLQHENASSSAANRFLTSTGADLTLIPNKCAIARYDNSSSRWRVYLCN